VWKVDGAELSQVKIVGNVLKVEVQITFTKFDVEDSTGIQGGLVPNKISGVGTSFRLLVHVFLGPNKERALQPSILLS
jgi:hypothetical protein